MHSVSSYLFVPASRPERIEKALASGAGRVIVDLEDAVSIADKCKARVALEQWLESAQAPVAIRINAAETPWFEEDLALCAHPNVVALMIPKANSPDVLTKCAKRASNAHLLPLIETAAGFDALKVLGRVPGVERFVFGSIDFQLDLGISGDDEELLFFRSQIVLASRLAGLEAPVDGVTTDIADKQKVQADAARARKLGFGAKLCIHPLQVEVVNAAFRPLAQEIDWARRVMIASETAEGAAASVDGKMIDRPVVLRARVILEQSAVP